MSEEFEEEEAEPLSVKDSLILSVGTLAFLIGAGYIARIGWDLAGESSRILKRKLEDRKARKESEESP